MNTMGFVAAFIGFTVVFFSLQWRRASGRARKNSLLLSTSERIRRLQFDSLVFWRDECRRVSDRLADRENKLKELDARVAAMAQANADVRKCLEKVA